MFKLKFYIILLFLFISFSFPLSANVFIKVIVDDEIITNIDIEKEAQYLMILNPKLLELDKKSTYEISKKSIINEIIKKKEIVKIIDFKKQNPLEDEMLKNLYDRLNTDKINFEKTLSEKKSYTLDTRHLARFGLRIWV